MKSLNRSLGWYMVSLSLSFFKEFWLVHGFLFSWPLHIKALFGYQGVLGGSSSLAYLFHLYYLVSDVYEAY